MIYILGVKATGYIGMEYDQPPIGQAFDQIFGNGPQAGDSNKLFKFIFDEPQVQSAVLIEVYYFL